MNNMCKIFILLFGVMFIKNSMAYNFSGNEQTVIVNRSFTIADSNAIPGKWLKLGGISMKTVDSIDFRIIRACQISGAWCTGAQIGLGHTGQANYTLHLTRMPLAVKDDAGNNYLLSVAFSDGPVVVGISEFNSLGGNKWHGTLSLPGVFSNPSESQDKYSSSVTWAKGWCGAIPGCDYTIASYPHTSSGMPYIYLKLPANLSARRITIPEQPVLKMKLNVGKKSGSPIESQEVSLYLKGTITVPQRCYIKADNNNFDFGLIYSNATNGMIKQQTMKLTTDCYYAPDNTTQSIKVEAVSGGTLVDNDYIYQIATDTHSQKALGIVFNINSQADCNGISGGRNVFNWEYLTRTIKYQAHQSETDTVNFSLCKYGVPTEFGQKNIVLKITSRWVAG
ncbi:hypothetical protein [Escherichia albertii]|uniref:Fimbrial protein n=1 Tax=Escherichia albertii TaxID=208962 RepID=A0AAX3MRV7_ESCAL|nr:hypothetical protein [Escherichia albertii]MCZ8653731.1 hypothetical protein [Escherichia albertii]WDB31982.1 hypothetical protein PS049_25625 [Escherichia albertii]